MPSQPPYRMPCDAVAGQPLYFLGSPFQHALVPVLADKYVDVTTVPNPDTEAGGTVPPYERFTHDPGGAANCETHQCIEDGPAPCAAWLRPFAENEFSHTSADNVNFAATRKTGFKAVQARRYWNGRFGYLNKETTAAPDHVEGCGDETQARWRAYTGAIDGTKFLSLAISASWSQTTYDYSGGGGPTNSTATETMSMAQHIDAQSGLYLFSDLVISPDDDRNHAFNLYSPALWKWSDIVSRMTVEITPLTGGTKVCSGDSITITDELGRVLEQVTWDLPAGTFDRKVYQWSSTPTQLLVTEESVTVTNTEINYALTTNEYNTIGGGPDNISASTVLQVTGTLSNPNTSASIYADVISLLGQWDLSDDAQYPWRSDLKVSAAPLVSRDELLTTDFTESWFVKNFGAPLTDPLGAFGDPGWQGHCGILLAPDPKTGATIVSQDLPTTAGEVWDGTFIINPFSQCAVTSFSIIGGSLPPGISFNPTTGAITGTASADGHYGITVEITGAAPAVTGNVLGAPKPAGHQGWFDFAFQDILGCCYRPPDNPGFQTWSWYQHGWGMDIGTFNSTTGCALPLNATQWSNYFQSVNKPQGAWLFYNDTEQDYFGDGCVSSAGVSGAGDAQALWACKYAEALEQWPSQNFARPAGDDKFAFDENHVVCATQVSGTGEGSTWAITDPTTGLAPADGADFSGIWGGPVVGGFFNVADYSSGTLTLGAKAYDVPSNWASKSNGDEAQCFGKLRFLGGAGGASIPASLLGRAAITPDIAGTTFTFAASRPAFGMDSATHQEQVDLYDATMALLAGNVTTTRLDDTHFTVPPGSAAVSAAWVQITGSAAWYMNDAAPKGDYALLEWLADLRSPGEYNRLAGVVDCSATQISQPSVNSGGGPVANPFASFTQTPGCLPFVPCAPKVVCVSPNGETFANGITYNFPETFTCDEQYGSKWWAYVQSTMTDLFWQRPHRPCNIKPCARWIMDSGICANNAAGSCPGDDDYVPGESEPPEYFFGHAPQVETRLTLPANYGVSQDESAPALPVDIQIGWLSPVFFSTGDVALPPQPPGALSNRGEPAGAATAWDLHTTFCLHAPECRFNYVLTGC